MRETFTGWSPLGSRAGRDERDLTGILTLGFQTLLPPSQPGFVGMNPDQWPWKLVTHHSGVTVPDFHGVPWHRIAMRQTTDGTCPSSIKEQRSFRNDDGRRREENRDRRKSRFRSAHFF